MCNVYQVAVLFYHVAQLSLTARTGDLSPTWAPVDVTRHVTALPFPGNHSDDGMYQRKPLDGFFFVITFRLFLYAFNYRWRCKYVFAFHICAFGRCFNPYFIMCFLGINFMASALQTQCKLSYRNTYSKQHFGFQFGCWWRGLQIETRGGSRCRCNPGSPDDCNRSHTFLVMLRRIGTLLSRSLYNTGIYLTLL